MPRKSSVPHEEILAALLSFDDYFDDNGKLHSPKADIWNQVASKLGNRLKSNYLWQLVWEGRNHFLAKIRLHLGLDKTETKCNIPIEDSSSTALSDSYSESSACGEEKYVKPEKTFILTVTSENWKTLQPLQVSHIDKNCSLSKRTRLQLAPGWTGKITDLLWDQHKIPCPYTYKKCTVATREDVASQYVLISAFCKECKSPAIGKIIESPMEGEGTEIIWRAADTRGIPHNKKRPATGKERMEIAKEVRYISASMYRKTQSLKKMDYGDLEPSNLPKSHTIRKIKQEGRIHDMGLPRKEDPISALVGMKYLHPFAGIIHDICVDKFMVNYHSAGQRRFYKEFRKLNYTIVTVDATGSLVQKIKRPGTLSGHIFLYEVVLNTGYAQLPILQMLSEKHDANTITYWFNEWERCGMPTPHQVVCDQSKALLSALARSFGKCSSYRQYKEECFEALLHKSRPPPCFIRIDIAHFISSATHWKLWSKGINRRIQEFYLRCLGLLIKCTTLQLFEDILLNIFCCALAESDGSVRGKNVPSQSESSREKLLDLIETFRVDEPEKENKVNKILVGENNYTDEDNDFETSESLQKWVSNILSSAKEKCANVGEGDRVSPYFSPEVASKFSEIALDFCVWSAVAVELFGAPNITASSASVEGDFNELKHRILQGDVGPLAVHKFIAKHILAVEGGILLASAPAKHCSDEPAEASCEELNFSEDWKGLGLPIKKRRVSKYTMPCPEIKAVQEANKLKPSPPSLQLLQNGNLTGFMTFGSSCVQVLNTCPFDSVCQILALLYSEDECYRDLMRDEANLTVATARSLSLYGATAATYRARCAALSAVLKPNEFIKPSNKTLMKYECWGNASTLLKQLFKDLPSITFQSSCHNLNCDKHMKMKITKLIVLDASSKIILEKGLNFLDDAVTACFPKQQHYCCGSSAVSHHIGQCVFVDIDFLGSVNIGSLFNVTEKYNRQYRLNELPPKLKVGNVSLKLRGVVAHRPGHYVGYGLRVTGEWEEYNDLLKCVTKNLKDTHLILPHLLIYSR